MLMPTQDIKDNERQERIKKAIAKYLRTHETTGGKKLGGGYFEKRRSWKRREWQGIKSGNYSGPQETTRRE